MTDQPQTQPATRHVRSLGEIERTLDARLRPVRLSETRAKLVRDAAELMLRQGITPQQFIEVFQEIQLAEDSPREVALAPPPPAQPADAPSEPPPPTEPPPTASELAAVDEVS